MADTTTAPVLQDTNWLDDIMNVTNKLVENFGKEVFGSVQSLLHNGVAYSVIGVIVLFWLLNLLKQGYPSREDLFKAGKWIFIVCFVMGIFSSIEAYNGFLSYLSLPASWVRASVSTIFNNESGNNFGEIVVGAVNKLGVIYDLIWEKLSELEKKDLGKMFGWASPPFVMFKMITFYIYAILFFFVLIGVVAMICASTFMATLILACCPIVLPFIAVPNLKQYFFSWLKLYISYSMYAPFALIIFALIMSPLEQINKLIQAGQIEEVSNSMLATFFSGIIVSVIALYLLKKIPEWITNIIGVAGGAMGGGLGVASMAQTGATLASAGAGGVAGYMAGQGGALSKLAGFAKGAGQGAIDATPGAKTLQKASEMAISGAGKALGVAGDLTAKGAAKAYKAFKGGYASNE